MTTKRKAVGVMLLCGAIFGVALPSQALGGERVQTRIAPVSSSSARASATATIVQRADFTCDRILRAATVEIVTVPRLADDHRHPVAVSRLDCTHLRGLLDVSVVMMPVETADRRSGAGASVFAFPMAAEPTSQRNTGQRSGHNHIVEVIYNFE